MIKSEHSNLDYQKIDSFYIYSKWCPRRNLDAAKVHKYFTANKIKPASDPKNADITVIFTCGVYGRDEELSISTIENTIKNKNTKTVITGCLPKITPKKIRSYTDALIISPENLTQLDDLIGAKTQYGDIKNFSTVYGINEMYRGKLINRIKKRAKIKALPARILQRNINRILEKKLGGPTTLDLFNAPTTYRLEIAKGCMSNCSYCAIKVATEKFYSYTEDQILENFKYGIKKGYSDFVLISADIGCYGLDIQTNLPALLRKLFSQDGNFKLLLWDLNALWFVKYYKELSEVLISNSEKVSKIIVPIQSGSNRILKQMNRGYKIKEVKECILDLKKKIPEIKVDTHIIVGFPGETDEDFQKSLQLVKSINFSEVEVFKYEDRPKTRSLQFSQKVPQKTVNTRALILAKAAKGVIVN